MSVYGTNEDIVQINELLNESNISLDSLDIIDKISHFLMLMGNDFASNVFTKLPQKLVTVITKRMIEAKPLKKLEMLKILEEFNYIILSNQYIIDGGIEHAKDILSRAFGPNESKKILEKLLKSMGKNNYFAFLTKIKSQQLADFIENENAQTIAIILSHMEPAQAAETLEALDANKKIEISIRMANLKDVSPNIIKNIAELLEQKLELLSSNKIEIGGTRTVAEIFNRMGSSAKDTIDMIEVFDSELAQSIKEKMFTFEDIIKIEQESMIIVKNAIEDKNTIAKAIKNVDETLQNKFLDAMSDGEKEDFLEEMSYINRIRIKEVEMAQAEIVEAAQRLLESDAIFLDLDDK
jgi:flagellar motor switch protein FliG